uniref:ABM domain-containing protein n=1 Tax=Coccolithus braarudii TaxID=221442 RepID=A0A7S0Q9H1_9EUKA|mmetsp:Transcript_49556/g.105807  ORF Transcript_49556/g.105807 Transcript_49556/m.105807 type:complete len:151 (+) Transcript_49556:8-460(+)
MLRAPTVGSFAAGILATLATTHVILPALSGHHYTSTGRAKQVGDNAFVLSVGLTFRSVASAESFTTAWAEAASYCRKNEPFLYQYEVSQSDKNALEYVIMERYRSKADYVDVHRHSSAFNQFRPKLRALQEAGEVAIKGGSYVELGIGFT